MFIAMTVNIYEHLRALVSRCTSKCEETVSDSVSCLQPFRAHLRLASKRNRAIEDSRNQQPRSRKDGELQYRLCEF